MCDGPGKEQSPQTCRVRYPRWLLSPSSPALHVPPAWISHRRSSPPQLPPSSSPGCSRRRRARSCFPTAPDGDKKPVPAPPQPRLPGRCRCQDGGAASRRCVVPRPAPPGRAGDPVAATCCRRARCCSCCSWCCCRCPRCSCPRCCCRLGRRRPRASCTPRRKMRVQCAVSRGGGYVCVLGGVIK